MYLSEFQSVALVTELFLFISVPFALGPVTGALRAHEDEVKAVFGGLGESDGLVVTAPLAHNIFPSRKRRILNTLRIHMQILSPRRIISPINTVVHLIVILRPTVTVAQLTVELEGRAVSVFEFSRLEHVVALGAEAHSFELAWLGLLLA